MTKYIGNIPSQGEFKKLDSIASSFDGSTTQFNLNYNSVSQSVGGAEQLIVSLNGVVQEPLSAYTLGVGGSSVVFSSAPASGDTCHIVLFGGVGGTATPSDNSVTAEKIASADDFTFGSITVTGSGSIDGRDISTDGTKLDGIEENADVTDTANVTAAGALMDSELTDEASVKALNQGVATTDSVTFAGVSTHEFDLSAIDATINDTAVDVFVYDTRKDSDGGAWRKRTQHTSWYNETLNTATRGSRKEFPAVAVIVTTSSGSTGNAVTIYDGDDPDLPMWMVFNQTTYGHCSPYVGPVEMKNGLMIVGTTAGGNGYSFDNFIEDAGGVRDESSHKYWINKAIADRDVTASGYGQQIDTQLLVNRFINDVAMTVLPNAPIDAATGLPVPTIAVATNGGVSVIKDNGTVVDLTTSDIYDNYGTVDFIKGGRLLYTTGGGTSVGYTADIPSSDYNLAGYSSTGTGTSRNEYFAAGHGGRTQADYPVRFHGGNVYGETVASFAGDSLAIGTFATVGGRRMGLTLLDEVPNDPMTSSVAWINAEYNTGWMNGDIKLATLSDTDYTDVTGTELVTNGTFNTDTSGWTQAYVSVAPTVFTSTNGQFVARRGDQYRFAKQEVTVEVGKTYTVSVDSPTGDNLMVGKDVNSNQYGFIQTGAAGTGSVTFTATQTALFIMPHTYKNQTTDAIFDNISVRLAEEDRSVNGKGLQVIGTVIKSAVATGADLVSYRSNGGSYLGQPSAGSLVLTDDFSVTWWQKHDTVAGVYEGWQIAENDITGATNYSRVVISVMHEVSSQQYLIRGSSVTGASVTNGIASGSWTCLTLTKEGSTIKLYTNGELSVTTTGTTSTPSNPYSLQILRWQYATTWYYAANSELSLFRTSNTVPSPEQIKKIYEDEKFLFQENAKATLYGTSDAVTALAYDDDTELLHVGTSEGRSVFQGLRRIDNTTDAVGSAISASNGMVAED